jgi:hypothetical protein
MVAVIRWSFWRDFFLMNMLDIRYFKNLLCFEGYFYTGLKTSPNSKNNTFSPIKKFFIIFLFARA